MQMPGRRRQAAVFNDSQKALKLPVFHLPVIPFPTQWFSSPPLTFMASPVM
jgi:hypothetical protein